MKTKVITAFLAVFMLAMTACGTIESANTDGGNYNNSDNSRVIGLGCLFGDRKYN